MHTYLQEGLASEASERAVLGAGLALENARIRTSVAEERRARASADEALAAIQIALGARIDGVEANTGALEANLAQNYWTRAQTEGGISTAVSGLRNELTAEMAGLASSSVVEGVIAQVENINNAVTAIGGRTTTIETQLGAPETGIAARLATVEATRVTASGAVAAVNAQISASYGSLTALAWAEATLDGISSGYVWRLGGEDMLSLVRVDDGTTGPGTTVRISGDYIRLDGNVQVTGDFVIASGTSGQRLEQRPTGIWLYDSNNIARFELSID